MYNEETIKDIELVEREYQLDPIRGANETEIDTARYIRATAIRNHENALRRRYNRYYDEDYDTDRDPREETRQLASVVFPIPDAYTIITQARMNPHCENDIMPLMPEFMQPRKNVQITNIAWRYLILLEEASGLAMITNVDEYSNAAATISRLNVIRGCREMIKRLRDDKVQPYKDAIERLSRKDVDIKVIREANELIPPRSVNSI